MWLTCVAVLSFLHFINGIYFQDFGNEFEHLTMRMVKATGNVGQMKSGVQVNWIEQPVDHFNVADHRVWRMRYFENLEFSRPHKPIYLFLGAQAPIHPVFIQSGLMFDLAKETNGSMFIAEHRYYGKSNPFQNVFSESLKYLSSRQALADYAKLLESLKTLPIFKSSKVVVVGGSYSGSLAVWMRALYPNLVDAAIASSAPVLAKKDFYEYMEVVSDNFKKYGSVECWNQIAQKFAEYEELLKTDEGLKILEERELICDMDNFNEPDNRQNFFFEQTYKYRFLAQYGGPREIKEFCENNFTMNFPESSPHNLIQDGWQYCNTYNVDIEVRIAKRKNRIAWPYQTCTEFGYFQTTTSDNHPFTKNVPVDLFVTFCRKLFGPDFDEGRVDRGVEETNKLYGGLSPNVSNVIFVNGDMDPLRRLSVLKDLSPNVPSVVIRHSSHCRDLLPKTDSDHRQLKAVRLYIRSMVLTWIGEKH